MAQTAARDGAHSLMVSWAHARYSRGEQATPSIGRYRARMFVLRRSAARVLLIDNDSKVLLIRAHDPQTPDAPAWWELPGGGIDPGERSEACCTRELAEEVGVRTAVVGPIIWTQHCKFTFAGWKFDQDEVIHVARCETNPPIHGTALESLEVLAFESVKWWTLEDLLANDEPTLPPAMRSPLPHVIDRFGQPTLDESIAAFEQSTQPPLNITDEANWTW